MVAYPYKITAIQGSDNNKSGMNPRKKNVVGYWYRIDRKLSANVKSPLVISLVFRKFSISTKTFSLFLKRVIVPKGCYFKSKLKSFYEKSRYFDFSYYSKRSNNLRTNIPMRATKMFVSSTQEEEKK